MAWAQRHIQISFVYRESDNHCRGIPVAFFHAPVPKKPGKRGTAQQHEDYKIAKKEFCLPKQASRVMLKMENDLGREIIWVGDGGYTNQNICRSISHTIIGRIRKDAKLFLPPEQQNTGKGRKMYYGEQLPTPEQILKSDLESTEVRASTGNGEHTFTLKSITNVRSKLTGEKNVKIVVISPLKYRLTQNGKVLYREPAYLICTDPTLSDQDILQYYLWRWQIELNFKDEKSLFGIDESHVWCQNSVESFPAFVAAVYSLLLLACKKTYGDKLSVKYPKWRDIKTAWRPSTATFLANIRTDFYRQHRNKSGFADILPDALKPLLFKPLWESVVSSAK